ncbi:MAG: GIY-YIG nuclease family protein [Planctomycetota bacterium]|nr:GIY-YIG nuclease family protein [Planctomycetota bacterium]
MNHAWVYVLEGNDNRLYVGSTRQLQERLESHKMGRVRSTKGRRPVRLVHQEEYDTYTEARRRELYLKTGTGRNWLSRILETRQETKD